MKLNYISLECNVVHHCNFSCASCSHFSPMSKPRFVHPEELYADLMKITPYFHSDRFAIIGGEPLLHPDMKSIAKLARDSGISETLYLLTNATLLNQQPDDILCLFNVIGISRYPGVFTDEEHSKFERRIKGLGIKYEIYPTTEFYRPFRKTPREGGPNMENFRLCPYREKCLTIQDGHLFRCPGAWQIPEKVYGIDPFTDGLKLDGATYETIKKYLTSSEPLKSCSVCCHLQSTDKEMNAWHQCKKSDWMGEAMTWI